MANLNEMKLDAKVQEIATNHGIKEIYYGSGYPVPGPHIVVIWKDWLSGEGYGYNVWVRPYGSGNQQKYYSVTPE